MDKPQILLHQQKGLNFTLYDSKWIPSSARFVVLGGHARGTGALQIYEIAAGDVEKVTEVEKSNTFKCGTFGQSSLQDRHLATGDFQGRVHIWDLERLDLPVYSVKGHSAIVNAIDGVGGLGIGEGAPELVTSSRDGTVKVWDPRQKNEPVACMEPDVPDGGGDALGATRDCWAVAFGHAYNPHDRCVAAGYDNGDIKLFDLRKMSVRWETNVKNGVCNLEFDRKDIAMNKLVATTLEGKMHVFDTRTQHPTDGFARLTEKCHKSTVWLVKHLPQNRDVFITAGGAGNVCLWKYNYPVKRQREHANDKQPEGVVGTLSQLQSIVLATQPLSGWDWSPDKSGLAVCVAFDQTLRVIITTKTSTL